MYQQLQLQTKRTKHTANQNQKLIKQLIEKMNDVVELVTPYLDNLKNKKEVSAYEYCTQSLKPCKLTYKDIVVFKAIKLVKLQPLK